MYICRLCSELKLNNPKNFWNVPLFESQNFVVLPSLGAIVEGWLLIVPKTHFICIGEMSDLLISEMIELKEKMCGILEENFGPVVSFEHGPNKIACQIGCGVDHAHLHIVPCDFDLSEVAKPFLPNQIEWSEANHQDCKIAFQKGKDYLYVEQPIGKGRIAIDQKFESQIFRKAIASEIGIPTMYNWREYQHLSNIKSTIEKLQKSINDLYKCQNKLKLAA
jgi:ATP adenylyltransferase